MTIPLFPPLRVLVLGSVLGAATAFAQSPMRPPAVATVKPALPGLVRIVAQRGEVLLDKGGNGAETTEPLRPTAVLAKTDEVSTHHGTLELGTTSGLNLRLGEDSWLAILSATDFYLARGDLQVVQPVQAVQSLTTPTATPTAAPTAGQPATPHPEPAIQSQAMLNVALPCGRASIKGRDVRLRVQGTTATVAVFDGSVLLAGASFAKVTIASGQSIHCAKGQPIAAVRPLLPALTWPAGTELFLVGDGSAPASPALHWPAVATAQRYRINLARIDNEVEVPVSTTEVPVAKPQLDLQKLAAGTYVARVQAIDDTDAVGQQSLPHRFLVTRVAGLGPDGTARTEAGTLPRISVPRGQTFTVLLDGNPPSADAISAGPHKLRIVLGDLSADVSLLVTPKTAAPVAEQRPAEFQDASLSVWNLSSSDGQDAAPAPEAKADKTEPSATPPPKPVHKKERPPTIYSDMPKSEDALLGGVGEVPFGGVRSPWTRSYLGGRLESTTSGSLRIVFDARWAMRNGFGLDLSANLLRAAIANQPAGQDSLSYGNLNLGARTPALRLPHLALQGLVNVLVPLSSSFLDTSIEQDSRFVTPGSGDTILRPGVRPRGGGWRVEPALLIGVRVRGFTISTMQGVSLRVSPDVGASYAGGLLIHNEIVPALRFVTFAAWQINYLGLGINPGDPAPDVGGAVGGGFEALIPTGPRGNLRLGVLGRVGLGDGGVAIYGRGSFGLQLGYLFN